MPRKSVEGTCQRDQDIMDACQDSGSSFPERMAQSCYAQVGGIECRVAAGDDMTTTAGLECLAQKPDVSPTNLDDIRAGSIHNLPPL
jgi:hypothetical protein